MTDRDSKPVIDWMHELPTQFWRCNHASVVLFLLIAKLLMSVLWIYLLCANCRHITSRKGGGTDVNFIGEPEHKISLMMNNKNSVKILDVTS